MTNFRILTGGIFGLIFLIISLTPAYADVSLVTSGISAIVGNNISQAEKNAFDDAFFKAYLEVALKQVSGSSSADLTQRLRGFVSTRGNQDIIQYQLVSRSQQGNILFIELDIKLNDAPLRDWLQTQALTTPLGLRPKILLMISTRGPAASEKYEWWNSNMNKGYSSFETQLAQRLKSSGENVSDIPQRVPAPGTPGTERVFQVASAVGADFVITGSITYKFADASTLDSRLDLSLLEIKSRQKLSAYSIVLKGTVEQKTMNELLITAVLEQIRSGIARKVVVVNQIIQEKSLCIEGIRDYDTYESIITALRSMGAMTKITISGIQDHSICHTVEIKGNLQDILDSLKQKQIAQADMMIKDNGASIHLLNP
jgi:hypothetical protein